MELFTNDIPALLSWFQQTEIIELINGEYDTGIALAVILALLALWIFTRVLRALIGTALLVGILYLAVKLVLGVDLLPYVLP